jgi:hypothetical protein
MISAKVIRHEGQEGNLIWVDFPFVDFGVLRG